MSDKIQVLRRVEDVQVLADGKISTANLVLTSHHLVVIQAFTLPTSQDTSKHPLKPKTRENFIAYPSISQCTFKPTPPASGLSSSIRLRCRDFRFITLNFTDDRQARDVYDTIKCQTCRLGAIEKLYAFTYNAPPPEKAINGWELYDAKAEWRRQGISEKGVDRGWRISKINTDYAFSPTYPALLVVPSSISDNTINYAGRYRSRVRIPALTYLHPVNNCSITRSSQPLAGLRGNRSIQDEKLVSACFSASAQVEDDETSSQPISRSSPASSQVDLGLPSEGELSDTERLEDEMISSSNLEVLSDKPHVYGAQQHNLIVDARPTVNALAMQAVGLGSENMDHYKFATKAYLGIDNIHVMRDSLAKVIEAIKDSDISTLPPNRELLAKSGWLKHIRGLLDGAALVARQVGIQHSHVLIHCSDGWDRTSQLSALSQLMLDPYYRTIDGFIVLVEKDWLAFGHMFQHRSGFLNSEKWFKTENDALAGSAIQPGGNGEGRGDAIENALLSAKRFFNKSNASQDTVTDSDGEMISIDESPKANRRSGTKNTLADKEATKPKETSPVFHQFLDCTYQLLHQYPTRFEFNERFLRRMLYHLYSCQYGTFLYNNEKSRFDARVQERTTSVWSYFLAQRAGFTNKDYDGGEIEDHVRGKERLLFPKLDQTRWWPEIFNRTNSEMNGPTNAATERYLGPREDSVGVGHGVLTGVETAERVIPASSIRQPPPNGNQGKLASLRDGIAGLGIVKSMGGQGGSKSPANGKEKGPMEVEMQ
ncbi:phosphatases II [Acephala macrosclerotiorum]|nr:phosphatases II [Acephala macrosclerotiorum]